MKKNLLSLAALSLTACSSALAGQLYLVGSPSEWAEPSENNANVYANWVIPETEEGSLVYTGKFNVAAGSQEMRFYSALDGWGGSSLGAFPDDFTSKEFQFENGTFNAPVMKGRGNYEFEWAGGDLYLRVDLNASIATFSDKEITDPVPNLIYLLGNFNDWDRSNISYPLFETSTGSNVYKGAYDISANNLIFKIMETPNCEWDQLLCSSSEYEGLNYSIFGKDGVYTAKYECKDGSAWIMSNWRGGNLKFIVDKNNETLTLDYPDFFGLPDKLYLVGKPQNWDISDGSMALVPDVSNEFLYKGVFNIPESAFQFRFCKELGNWQGGQLGAGKDSFNVLFQDGTYTGACEQGEISFTNNNWSGAEVAITVDLANYTVTFDAPNYVEPDVPENDCIYLVGSPSGWTAPSEENSGFYNNWALPMTEEGIYKQTFYLESSDNGIMFRFYKGLSGWDGGDSYGIQENDSPIDCQFNEKGVFDGACIAGKGSYSFPDWTTAYLNITVDLNNSTVTMVKSETDAIDSVIIQEATPVYYRLDGIRVMGSPTSGFYIKRQGNKATKVVF